MVRDTHTAYNTKMANSILFRPTMQLLLALLTLLLTLCVTPNLHSMEIAIANFHRVDENTLWRGARPEGSAIEQLIHAGVATIVNLEWENDNLSALAKAKPKLQKEHSFGYLRVKDFELWPLLSWGTTDDNVARFIAITRTQPKPIYIHCRSGQNRTGIMVAMYELIEKNKPLETVIKDLRSFGGFWAAIDEHYLRGINQQRLAEIEGKITSNLVKLKVDAIITCGGDGCQRSH
jgi:protein tyrosine/serine phosphatase